MRKRKWGKSGGEEGAKKERDAEEKEIMRGRRKKKEGMEKESREGR